ncbi:hypothetical protein PAPHI01_1083 [Pancytospora philotis]|nr:hypothetical protein PAPHI01_1083 [Pancytospora philotis]
MFLIPRWLACTGGASTENDAQNEVEMQTVESAGSNGGAHKNRSEMQRSAAGRATAVRSTSGTAASLSRITAEEIRAAEGRAAELLATIYKSGTDSSRPM